MKDILLVGLGGCIGAVSRYKLGDWILLWFTQPRFPYNTFAVNVIGCLFIGVLAGLGERYDVLGPGARLFLITGLLGGFTTFSSFGLETLTLLRRDEFLIAGMYAVGSVVLGLIAVWLGLKLILTWPG